MIRMQLKGEEPLRMALALMVLALLLPLGVMIWLLLKSVATERIVAREELVNAYRQQIDNQMQDLRGQWHEFLREPTRLNYAPEAVEDWMRQGGIEAVIIVDRDGNLAYPDPTSLSTVPNMTGSASPSINQLAAELSRQVFPLLRERETRTLLDSESTQVAAGVAQLLAQLEQRDLSPDDQYLLLRLLLRSTESAMPEDPWYARQVEFWSNLFQTDPSEHYELSLRQKAFLAGRLLALEHLCAELPGDALRKILRQFETRESLLQAFSEKRWKPGDNLDPRRFMLLTGQQGGRERIVNIIKEQPDLLMVVLMTEQNLVNWLIPVLENYKAASQLWMRVNSPWESLYDSAPEGSPVVVSLDLPDPFIRWTLEIGFMDEAFLLRTTRQQTAFSIYAGVALVLLILFAGFLALHQLNNQIRLNKLKNDFIGMVSHELRTPLASMRMLVDTLIEGRYRNEETMREYLAMISSENQRLSRLVDKFLTFSRMQRGKSHFERHLVAPAALVNAALAATKPHLEDERVTFTCNIAENLPDLLADEDAMVTVLINLIENAYKYSGDQKSIQLTVDQVGDQIRFAVQDNGIGIAPRELKMIFREFYQVDNHLSRRSEGSGLGLSINKHIVRAHNGRIDVRSELGVGSCFEVFIPITSQLDR